MRSSESSDELDLQQDAMGNCLVRRMSKEAMVSVPSLLPAVFGFCVGYQIHAAIDFHRTELTHVHRLCFTTR